MKAWILPLCTILAIILLCVSPFFGEISLIYEDIFEMGTLSHRIFFEIRLPRVLLALFVGGSLCILGATYQTLFRNPLADPYVLGISSAVSLGVALSQTYYGASSYSLEVMLAGFFSGLIVSLLIIIVSISKLGEQNERIILFGLGLNFVLSSILFLVLSYREQQIGGGSIRWLFGQIPVLEMSLCLKIILLTSPLLAFLLLLSRKLDALSLGDSIARTLGVSPRVTRAGILLTTSIIISILVSMTGAIGFIGVVVPHAVRIIFSPSESRHLMVWAFLFGGVFLVLSDVLSRILLPPYEFPIGTITTLFGGPLFLTLLCRHK